ncbi:hypothetical protein P5V15_015805 [Pogonomyrmex californicus]
MIRVTLMPQKKTQCYRCLEFGHLSSQCKSETDRSGLCYKCGKKGHILKQCRGVLRCVLCFEAGIQHNHRIGSLRCGAAKFPGKFKPVRRLAPVEGTAMDLNNK